jgi:hypothetical protein
MAEISTKNNNENLIVGNMAQVGIERKVSGHKKCSIVKDGQFTKKERRNNIQANKLL